MSLAWFAEALAAVFDLQLRVGCMARHEIARPVSAERQHGLSEHDQSGELAGMEC